MSLAAAPAFATLAFVQTNIVSDGSVPAAQTDPDLINPWGLALSATSPFWISDNGSGVATIYNGNGATVLSPVTVPPPMGSPTGTTSAPTGQVFNIGGTSDFTVSSGGTSGKPAFLFDTEDGTISGWSPTVNAHNAVLAVDNSGSGAVYKGLAIANTGTATQLYAANFNSGMVEVYNSSFHQISSFTDPTVPTGYAPFNVQTLNGHLYVTFALQDADKHDDVAGVGNGFVDEFDLSGGLIRRVASNGPLNSPWGLDIAPSSFGQFANDLLVGNFGDGTIHVYDPNGTNALLGTITNPDGTPVTIGDLWALVTGNNGPGADPNAVYFTAGVEDEAHGLFGKLSSTPEPGSLSLLLGAGMWLAWRRRRAA